MESNVMHTKDFHVDLPDHGHWGIEARHDGYRVRLIQPTGGSPQLYPDRVVERVLREHEASMTPWSIAAGMRADGVPTARGGQWRDTTIIRILDLQAAARIRRELAELEDEGAMAP